MTYNIIEGNYTKHTICFEIIIKHQFLAFDQVMASTHAYICVYIEIWQKVERIFSTYKWT